MAARSKLINLYLMDGEPHGRIKCTLANWTGLAYKIPRTELDNCKDRDDLSQSGVYFLFGISDQTGENLVYIGQAGVRKSGDGLLTRLQEHKRNSEKDYWTEAIVFTTSNNSFGPTEISYLENRFTSLAKNASRYVVTNSNDPTPGNVTEEKKSELEEFIDLAKIIVGTLGHKVFDPLLQNTKDQGGSDIALGVDSMEYQINTKTATAQARLTSEGIVVLAKSKISKDITPSCSESVRRHREERKADIDDDGVMLKDMLFSTPSGASAFVLGRSSNGTTEWKTADGRTLKEIESSK